MKKSLCLAFLFVIGMLVFSPPIVAKTPVATQITVAPVNIAVMQFVPTTDFIFVAQAETKNYFFSPSESPSYNAIKGGPKGGKSSKSSKGGKSSSPKAGGHAKGGGRGKKC